MELLRLAFLLALPLVAMAQVTPGGNACPGGTPNPHTWYLSGAQFGDGGTATGSFVYDANNGVVSAISVTTTQGSSFAGARYAAASQNGFCTATVFLVPQSGLTSYPTLLLVWSTSANLNTGGTV